jgi:hypothetical protein
MSRNTRSASLRNMRKKIKSMLAKVSNIHIFTRSEIFSKVAARATLLRKRGPRRGSATRGEIVRAAAR